MADGNQRIYLDSCVVLRYLAADPDIVSVMHPVFDTANRDSAGMALFTSNLSIAEVAFIVDAHTNLITAGDLELIDAFWRDAPILKVEPTEQAAERGRSFIRECKAEYPADQELRVKTRSVDALHIGTAKWINASELWTTDERMIRLARYASGLTICKPHVGQPSLFPDE